eukprot:Rmarinus@m.19910
MPPASLHTRRTHLILTPILQATRCPRTPAIKHPITPFMGNQSATPRKNPTLPTWSHSRQAGSHHHYRGSSSSSSSPQPPQGQPLMRRRSLKSFTATCPVQTPPITRKTSRP